MRLYHPVDRKTKGYLTCSDDYEPDDEWRLATVGERLLWEFHKPRLSIAGIMVFVVIYLVVALVVRP